MEKPTPRTATAGLSLILLAALGLSGCVTVEPGEETTGSAPATDASPTGLATGTPGDDSPSASATDSIPSASGGPASPTSSATGFDAAFTSIVEAADKKLECLDDDDQGPDDRDDLTLTENGMVISITGDCDDVIVTGNNLTVAMTEVDDLVVRGTDNVIAVQDLDNVAVTGSDNTIGWNPIHEDDPDTRDNGSGNVIRHDAVAKSKLDF